MLESYLFEPLAKLSKRGDVATRMLRIVGFEGVGAATVKWHHLVYYDKMESAHRRTVLQGTDITNTSCCCNASWANGP